MCHNFLVYFYAIIYYESQRCKSCYLSKVQSSSTFLQQNLYMLRVLPPQQLAFQLVMKQCCTFFVRLTIALVPVYKKVFV